MESHKPKPRKIIPCTADPSCKEMFGRQHDRLRHEVVQHRKVCEFSCGRCGRFFSSARMLEKHGGRCPGEIGSGRWLAAGVIIRTFVHALERLFRWCVHIKQDSVLHRSSALHVKLVPHMESGVTLLHATFVLLSLLTSCITAAVKPIQWVT
jgi:hypothetical protein